MSSSVELVGFSSCVFVSRPPGMPPSILRVSSSAIDPRALIPAATEPTARTKTAIFGFSTSVVCCKPEHSFCRLITFRVRHSRREMYIGHGRLWSVCLSVCLTVPGRIPTLLHGPRCNLGNGRGCPLVVHYWADLQSVHGFCCCDNMARTRNVSECLYSLYAWFS